ncbi:MAG: hypothetical protein ACJATV_001592 [Granulosicoccus sp.]
MQETEQLITRLVNDLTVKPRQLSIFSVTVMWWVVSWVYVVIATLVMGPLRATVIDDLNSHHFQFESAIGLMASLLITFTAWYSVIPSGLSRRIIFYAVVFLGGWVALYFMGLLVPAVEPAMHGKREYCYYESFIYSLPPLLFGCILMAKRFSLKPCQTGFFIGLSAGIMPALFMQFACMYDPVHILKLHILPGIICGLIGLLGFPVINKYFSVIKTNH